MSDDNDATIHQFPSQPDMPDKPTASQLAHRKKIDLLGKAFLATREQQITMITNVTNLVDNPDNLVALVVVANQLREHAAAYAVLSAQCESILLPLIAFHAVTEPLV